MDKTAVCVLHSAAQPQKRPRRRNRLTSCGVTGRTEDGNADSASPETTGADALFRCHRGDPVRTLTRPPGTVGMSLVEIEVVETFWMELEI